VGYNATANAAGAFAFGYTAEANAAGAVQFGAGTNALANSLRVGSDSPRLISGGAPGSPANGDMWIASGNVYVRTGGYTRNMTNI